MNKDTENPVVEQNNDTKPAENKNLDNQTSVQGNDNPNSVPYARFNDVTKQNKALQAQLDEMKNQMEEKMIQETNDLAELKTLSTEQSKQLKEYEAKFKVIQEQEAKEHSLLLEQIPEDEREIYAKLDVSDLRKLVAKAKKQSVLTDKSAPIRSGLKVNDTEDIWNMSSENKRKNWGDIVNFYKKK
tara:strand:+ start:379 stop:936 length:558 start_codon:yes stop_codon:yes gene_type:complete